MIRLPPSNEEIAAALDDLAALLDAQDANPYRARAYREAARVLRGLDRSAASILAEGGRKALDDLPAVGKSIALAIEEIVQTGQLPMLDRLVGTSAPEDLFTLVPGIGDELARRIHETLGVETLEDLEAAAHDGRLEKVPGIGERRIRAIQEVLAAMLSRSARRRALAAPGSGAREPLAEPPPVAAILAVDERYRRLAEAGRLRTIAPRRFNPERKSWLPILRTDDGGWAWTAMYSNTARAHDLKKTSDWVVVYAEKDGREGRWTAVTETRGPLAGRRVVRGREAECAAHYAVAAPP
jgi:hypothetical protein